MPRNSVVNAYCRSWDIRNLWICDAVFPTVGGVNPSLTIQAIAAIPPTASVRLPRAELFPRLNSSDRPTLTMDQ